MINQIILLTIVVVGTTTTLSLANASTSIFPSSSSYINETIVIEDGEPNEAEAKHQLKTSHRESPKLRVFQDIFSKDQMESVHTFFHLIDKMHNQTSIAQMEYLTQVARVHSLVYADPYIHRYENYRELKKAAGPQVNQELCIMQLEELNGRLDRLYAEKMDGKDINLFQLLDTYDWYPTGFFLGELYWIGGYNECLRLKINTSGGLAPTRYCTASFKREQWPKAGKLNELMSLKAAVCLPKACDSIRYKNKYELIENLVKFNARRVDADGVYLDYLYCLPDEDSTSRLWYHSPKTTAFVVALTLWIGVLIYATVRYEKLLKVESKHDKDNQLDRGVAVSSKIRIYRSLSLVHNVKSLFQTTSPAKAEAEAEKDNNVVNLNVLEGIKVTAMCYIITGHVLMCFTMLMNNGREMSMINLSNMSFFAANLMPGLAVNAFFTITGLLTAYLLFKNSEPMKLVKSPSKWFAFITYRYIRIMPLYLVVVMYTKYLAKYTGSGPMWDYGTSSLSSRRQCEQEPWFWTLSFTANLKNPLDHCVPSAWYLANDFQFFLVTPIFLAILQKRSKLGKLVIVIATLFGYLSAMSNIASTDYDLRPLASFMPHGFKTYVTLLSDTYTLPQYRIPAYLCGLLIGYALYEYEQKMVIYLKTMKNDENSIELEKPRWPTALKKYGPMFCLGVVTSSFALPFIGDALQSNRFYSRFLVAAVMPTYHLLFAISTGLYILLATTGFGNKTLNSFLASPFWRPFSRVSLCVVLTNIEVITYFTQTSTHSLYMDFKTLTSLNLFSIVMSYLVAIVVCITFESPLRASMNHLVASMVKGLTTKEKVQ